MHQIDVIDSKVVSTVVTVPSNDESPSCGVLRAIQRDVLKTLLYFDIFDFPLRLPEIHQFLPTNSVAITDLRTACLSYPLHDQIKIIDDYVILKDRPESIVANRKRNERRAHILWKVARIMGRIVGSFPFVRAIFVSGELSKGVASAHSDIDLLIVSENHRVWIVRTLCAVFKRIFLFNQKKLFCYNHIVSQNQLEITERNLYTAIETVTLKPLLNVAMFERFRKVNPWTNDFLPNSSCQSTVVAERAREIPILEQIVVNAIPKSTLDTFDEWLMRKWKLAWEERYPSLTPLKRSELFQCTSDMSTSYVKDYSTKIMEQYRLRLNRYGIS